jgi:hypothetical protein
MIKTGFMFLLTTDWGHEYKRVYKENARFLTDS